MRGEPPASSITVPAGGTASLSLTLNVPAATVGSSSSGLAFREVAGLVRFTPASSSDNNNVTLRVSYYLVPRALSKSTPGVTAMPASASRRAQNSGLSLVRSPMSAQR